MTVGLSHLYVKAELLQALEEGLLVAGHEGLHVGVDGGARLSRLLLDLQLNALGGNGGQRVRTAVETEAWVTRTGRIRS